MSTEALSGVGFEFLRDSTKLSEVRSVNRSGRERQTIEVTDLDSTGGYREYITGFRDGESLFWRCTGPLRVMAF